MGLIARALEEAGISTLSMSSARDITRAAWPPRSAYLDFPLGHTAGCADAPELNLAIMRDALAAFEALSEPGAMAHLHYQWAGDDDWKSKVFAPIDEESTVSSTYEGDRMVSSAYEGDRTVSPTYDDDRTPRYDTPQYQTQLDADIAAEQHDGEQCLVCAGIDY